MSGLDVRIVESMLFNFMKWSEKEHLQSYDWWDIWGTKYGGWAKSLYFRNKFLGSLFVMPLIILDIIYPSYRRFFVKKRPFPICHAHVSLGYINLFEGTGDKFHLDKARDLVPDLLNMSSSKAKSGLGWGMKHQWMTIQGLIPIDTPCNTQTAYPYELFARLHSITKEDIYAQYLRRILAHVSNDFYEWYDDDMLACSYSTIDKRKVINANSYRMFMLIDGGVRFDNKEYLNKGIATVKYIISKQKSDGSWPYSEDQEFVDCYHTVFVLKNLLKVKRILPPGTLGIDQVIEKGYEYYLNNLFDSKGKPKPFSVEPRFTIFTHDAYDLAESIGLFAEMRRDDSQLFELIKFAREKFQTREGWFVFRLYRFYTGSGIPYMRYANSAFFMSLTKCLKYYSNNDAKN